LVLSFSGMTTDWLVTGSDAQLAYLSPVDRFAREHA
jgi:hypothetical protein